MASYMRCYHHSNCEDRPAVAKCTKCGKGLCRECADKLRSESTGNMLCVDCLNDEMAADVAWADLQNSRLKREMITMIIGFVIGLVAEIVLFAVGTKNETVMMLFFISFMLFLPTLLASFGTIWRAAGFFEFFVFKIIAFLVLCVASPIMFIIRLVKRAKRRKIMKRYAELQSMKYYANEEYKKATGAMNTRLKSQQEFENELILHYGNLLKTNSAEANRRIEEERAKREEAEKKQKELEAIAEKSAKDLKTATEGLAAERNKMAQLERDAKANKREKTTVGSGRRAA